MKMSQVFQVLWVLLPIVMVGTCAYNIGHSDGERAQRGRNQCMCGSKRTCAFGPGIVGEQVCDSNTWDGTYWSRCEPKPFKE